MLDRLKTQFTDGNLERPAIDNQLNRHLVVIGTAEDGPMYELVTVADLAEAASVYGASGTLYRGIEEAVGAQEGSDRAHFVSGLRIGERVANRAEIQIQDENGNAVVVLTALHPSAIYNMVSFSNESARKVIKIYNPKSSKFSEFAYDLSNPNNGLVSIHNAAELVDAINADTNLRGILSASLPVHLQHFELEVTDSTSFIDASDTETVIDLSAIESGDYFINGDKYLNGAENLPVEDALNIGTGHFAPIVKVNQVYAVADSGVEVLYTKGTNKVRTNQLPKDGKNDLRFNTLLNMTPDAALPVADNILLSKAQGADATVVSEGYLQYRNEGIGAYDKVQTAYQFEAPFSVGTTDLGDPATDFADTKAFGGYDGTALATFAGKTSYTVNGIDYDVQLEIRPAGGGVNDWDVVDPVNTPFELAWADGTVTLTFTGAGPGDQYDGGDMRISFDSCRTELTEHATLSSLEAAPTIDQYFVRGNEILFGAPLPANLVVRYATIRQYELGTNLTVVDKNTGKLKILGRNAQPGSGGAAIDSHGAIIGINYQYVSGFPKAGTVALSGGTNGTTLTKEQLYDELTEAYDALYGSQIEVVVVPGAYLDETKTGYSLQTGLPVEKNAEYHLQMSNFLNKYNARGATTAVGFIGFTPLHGSGMNDRVTKADIANRALALTTPDQDDALRAANVLQDFANPWMVAVDAEVIFSRNGTTYAGTAETAVASYYASLPGDKTIYVDNIPNVRALRYKYGHTISSGIHQGKSQADALTESRIAIATPSGNGVRLADGPTLAAYGSDWDRLSTVAIVQIAMGRVRKVIIPFMGKFSTVENIQSMDGKVKEELNAMIPTMLFGFSHKILLDPKSRRIGKIRIPLKLGTNMEIREVDWVVALSADQEALAASA